MTYDILINWKSLQVYIFLIRITRAFDLALSVRPSVRLSTIAHNANVCQATNFKLILSKCWKSY